MSTLDEQVAKSEELREAASKIGHDKVAAAFEKAKEIAGTAGTPSDVREIALILLEQEKRELRSMWGYSVARSLEELAENVENEMSDLTLVEALEFLVNGIVGKFKPKTKKPTTVADFFTAGVRGR